MTAPRRRPLRLRSEHGPIRLAVRVAPEHPAALDALRIVARLVAQHCQIPPSSVAFDAPWHLTVRRGVAS